MSASVNEIIANGLAANANLLHRYLDDLKVEDYSHQPLPGANSTAWILGHLVITDRRVIKALGGTPPAVPDGFEARFTQTGKPAESQHDLGHGPDLLTLFDATRSALIDAVRACPAEKLAGPAGRESPMYSTLGELAAFMGQHTAMHVGQVTVVRRSLNYPVKA